MDKLKYRIRFKGNLCVMTYDSWLTQIKNENIILIKLLIIRGTVAV